MYRNKTHAQILPLNCASLEPKVIQIGSKLCKPPGTDPSSYYELFIVNVGQSVRYVIGKIWLNRNNNPLCPYN